MQPNDRVHVQISLYEDLVVKFNIINNIYTLFITIFVMLMFLYVFLETKTTFR